MLPRAFSILDAAPGRLEILNKVVGRGTALLASLPAGAAVTVLGPLGRSFPGTTADAVDLLLGGGSGIPPLCLQAQRAEARGLGGQVEVIYGGRQRADLALLGRLEGLDVRIFPCTEDGSHGAKGRVTDVLLERLAHREKGARVLACGPLPMLRAVGALCRERGVPCWLSLETEMACGVGICRGCMVRRAREPGYLCTCLEGPVVSAEEVVL
jgi:dihydroorotate dehydrogenase electron transfer subunit